MAKSKIVGVVGEAAVRLALGEGGTDAQATGMAVRYLLQLLTEVAPGNTVEVRVPPHGAVQCVEGPDHTRGTPPNVVEMDAKSWLALATGSLSWADGTSTGHIHASGSRADISSYLPLAWDREARASGTIDK